MLCRQNHDRIVPTPPGRRQGWSKLELEMWLPHLHPTQYFFKKFCTFFFKPWEAISLPLTKPWVHKTHLALENGGKGSYFEGHFAEFGSQLCTSIVCWCPEGESWRIYWPWKNGVLAINGYMVTDNLRQLGNSELFNDECLLPKMVCLCVCVCVCVCV